MGLDVYYSETEDVSLPLMMKPPEWEAVCLQLQNKSPLVLSFILFLNLPLTFCATVSALHVLRPTVAAD